MPLHLTKVAFATRDVTHLGERLAARAAAEGRLVVTTRFLPKRHVEVAGAGSLYWILKHQLIARSPITGFGTADDGRVAIELDPALVLVSTRPKRAHQGWRYLEAADAPPDLGGDGEGIGALPPELVGRLAELALL